MYIFGFVCNDISGCPAPSLLSPSYLTLEKLKSETPWPKEGIRGLASWEATGWVLGWYALSLVLQAVLPGEHVEGTELRSGGRLMYKFNAFSSAVVIVAAAGVGTFLQGPDFPLWTFIWDNYIQILTANTIISYALAIFVYVRSFGIRSKNKEKREFAAGGNTGTIIYDFFIGRELNPRITLPLLGTVDIKAFMEVRPGLLGWIILDLAFVAHQYKTFGYISDSIALITAFQALYVFDAIYMESAILTQIDMTTDGFGFMLSFGDLVWLPFIYSTQARYLAVYPVDLGLAGIAGILAVQALGYYIFRSANNQKNRFRLNPEDPKVAHLTYIQTKTGSRLITSGWWGTARHINYLGDWIMAWSYSLPTGMAGYLIKRENTLAGGQNATVVQDEARGWGILITYFYVLYFAILLIHRERRDEEKCKRKYGADWDKYTKLVPYRILPGVY